MKGKFKFTKEEDPSQNNHIYDSFEYSYVSRPVKSPSPDKRAANIIASTKSPEIYQAKRNATPNKEEFASLKFSQRSQLKEKPFQTISTPNQRNEVSASFKNVDTGVSSKKVDEKQVSVAEYKISSSPSNSKGRNIKIEIAADNPTEEFQIRHSSSRYRSEFRGELTELDYLKILKSKEEHIRELKQIIETLEQTTTNRRNEYDSSAIKNFENKINGLNNEVRELKVENQYLLSALEKNKPSLHSNKQEILQRQIRQLRQSLRDKQFEIEEITSSLNKKLEKDKFEIKNLESENQSLIRLLKQKKEKDQNDRSKEDLLSSSSLTVHHSQISKSTEKERLSLIKIKEIHQQNIKIAQESFYNEIKMMEEGFFAQIQELSSKVEGLNNKLVKLQNFKKQVQLKSFEKMRNQTIRDEAHKQKERHQQIQTVLLQKYSYYENQLQEQKRENQKLTLLLTNANKNIEELQLKSLTYSRDVSYLSNQESEETLRRQNLQMREIIKNLQNQLAQNEQTIQRTTQEKNEQIRLYENKLEFLLEEYESKIRMERSKYSQKINHLQNQLKVRQNNERQLIESHERDKVEIQQQLKDALKLYDKQNTGLKQSLLQKNNDINFLNEQFERAKSELSKINQSQKKQSEFANFSQECDRLKNRCIILERNVELLNQQLQQAYGNLNSETRQKQQLDQQNKELILENSSLKERLAKFQEAEKANWSLRDQFANLKNSNHELQTQLKSVSQQLFNRNQAYNLDLSNLRFSIDQKDELNILLKNRLNTSEQQLKLKEQECHQLKSLLDSIKIEKASLRYETIEGELKELKQLISQYYAKHKNRLDNEIVQEYYKLSHTHEIKIDENMKLLRQIEDLKVQLSGQTREKLLLSEKISLLENNITIYERELRERRQLYDQILQEKVRIEKEVLLTKKIKAEQSNLVDNFKNSTSEITLKIDRLVEFERERYRQIKNLVEEKLQTFK